MTEQNWRDLPAGRELDRLVAERMGWRVEPMHGGEGPRHNLLRPNGERYSKRHRSEGSAWANVPHYSTSVDAALTLPVTDGAWDITCDTAQGYAQVFINPHAEIWDGPTTWHDGQDRELALLMCRAWLAWKDGTA